MSPNGKTTAATLVGRESTTDIALLRAEGVNASAIPLESASLRTGALALAVGVRSGEPIAAFGSVESLAPRGAACAAARSTSGSSLICPYVAPAKAASRSTSRAAHSAWRCSGRDERLWPSIPAATIERVAGKLQTHGRIAHGYIGLGLQTAKLDGNGGIGAMVMSVDPTGPGSAVGVRQGDLIVGIGTRSAFATCGRYSERLDQIGSVRPPSFRCCVAASRSRSR